MTGNKGKVDFGNGSEESIDHERMVRTEYREGYQNGYEQTLQWRSPETLPTQNGTEAILWLTTDKGFADVSAHCFLKEGAWY